MLRPSASLFALSQLPAIISLVIPASIESPTAILAADISSKAPLLFQPPEPPPPTSIVPVATVTAIVTTTKTIMDDSTTTRFFGLEPVQTITTTRTVFTSPSSVSRIAWTAPAQMTDLSSFNVSHFSSGGKNLEIVNEIPSSAYSFPPAHPTFIVNAANETAPVFTNMSLIQIRYPAHSINPGNSEAPVGGSQFYSSPVDITDASNVTLTYSIFFPADFDFVLGGKLPGLYGGHTRCSGGDDALDCFSTRLMFRPGGQGELYLYAPKDKQTSALCNDPQSSCNAVYGLSIGRGSFNWARGNWTTVTQTVVLNTPGKQDGVFTLDVNGKPAISRDDVFYRDILTPSKTALPSLLPSKPFGVGPVKVTVPGPDLPVPSVPEVDLPSIVQRPAVGLPVSPPSLFDGLLGGHHRRRQFVLSPQAPFAISSSPPLSDTFTMTSTRMITSTAYETVLPIFIKTITTATISTTETLPTAAPPVDGSVAQGVLKTVQFAGVFFSTFFGGHDERYATPKDQYVWFKDFAVSKNDKVPVKR